MLHQTTQDIIADEIGRQIYQKDKENAKQLEKLAQTLQTFVDMLKTEAAKVSKNGDCKEALQVLTGLKITVNRDADTIRETINNANTWHDCRKFVQKLEV